MRSLPGMRRGSWAEMAIPADRFSNKRDPFDSSTGDDDNFGDMNLPKVNPAELWTAAHQSGEKQAKYGSGESRNTTPPDDCISGGETSDDVESFSLSSISSPSCSESDEELNTLTESMEYLKYTLDEEKKKNEELQNELTRYKQLLKMTKAKLNEQENGDFCLHEDFKSKDIPFNTLMHKTRAASQENLEQLRETDNASMRSQMERRIKDLESEFHKMKIQNSTKVLLEGYKQLFLVAVNTISVLLSKLNNVYDNPEVVQTRCRLGRRRYRPSLSTLSARPVPQYPCGSHLDHSLVFQSGFHPHSPNNSVLSNLTLLNQRVERLQQLENSIGTEVGEATTAELEMVFLNIQELLKNLAEF